MKEWKRSGFSLRQPRDTLEERANFRSKVNGRIPSVLQMTAQLGAPVHREIKSLRVKVDAIFISKAADQLAGLNW